MRRSISVLVLCAVAALLLVAGTRWLRQPSRRTVYVAMPVAYGVREELPVLFRGVEIGRVESVMVGRSNITVRLRLRMDQPPLRRMDRVHLAPIGLFGDRALVIDPGPDSAPMLAVGDTLHGSSADTATARDLKRVDSLLGEALKRFTPVDDSTGRKR